MNNYKDTGRVYTLQDLFDLGLKLEVGDEFLTGLSDVKIESQSHCDCANIRNETDKRKELTSSKQLDEYLEKQAMNEIKHTAQEDEAFESFDTFDAVVSGWNVLDKCIVDNKGTDLRVVNDCEHLMGKEAKILHKFKNKKGFDMALVEFDDGACFAFIVDLLHKPETPEQKAERERLEAAYDLYRIVTVAHGDEAKTIEHFTKFDYKDAWLSAIDKGYRKQ